jgi:uncharacterized protein YjiS (DUF1127 family)
MFSFEIRQSHQIGYGFLTTTLEALRTFADRLAHRHGSYRDYVHLSAMSDPELQDIGISRSDISVVVAGTYRRGGRSVATEGACHAPSIERSNRQRD